MLLANPIAISRVLGQVGVGTWLTWVGHFAALALYTCAHTLARPFRPLLRAHYSTARWLEAWAWGSGNDLGSDHLRRTRACADEAQARRSSRPQQSQRAVSVAQKPLVLAASLLGALVLVVALRGAAFACCQPLLFCH
jgi:hypothetical protein